MSKIEIGVTGTGSLIGQAVIKSLRNSRYAERVRLTGFDYFPHTVGAQWVDEHVILPDMLDPACAEGAWRGALTEAIRRRGLKYLFVGLDFELGRFARWREELLRETGCLVIVSDPRVIEIADDKYLTYLFLRENGLSHPQTVLAEDYRVGCMRFPCIVKPRRGARSRGVRLVKDERELADAIGDSDGLVVQEHVGDMSREYTCGIVCAGGRTEIIALRRTLKEGNTSTASFSGDTPAAVYDYLRAVTAHLRPFGACNMQLRIDDEGVPKIFEINARHSGTTYMRSLFGFHEVEYIMASLLGEYFPEVRLRQGTVYRYSEEFFTEHPR
jgi:carbamoyl-phosphate synthase large subunit